MLICRWYVRAKSFENRRKTFCGIGFEQNDFSIANVYRLYNSVITYYYKIHISSIETLETYISFLASSAMHQW